MKPFSLFLPAMLFCAVPALANVTVTSPANATTVASPVQYTATATTTCSKGVASMGIYIDNQLTYVVNGSSLKMALTLAQGTYNTVVEEWDYCGGATYTPVEVNVATATGVFVTSPTNASTVTSPVTFAASASTTACGKGVASMGIYVSNKLTYVSYGSTLNAQLTFGAGPQNTVVEEWDACGGASYTPVNFTVQAPEPPTVAILANPPTVTAGSSSTLTVFATGATQVKIAGSNGTSYTLPASGGTQIVTPGVDTTYTAQATGPYGTASATETVDVVASGSVEAIEHVVFMMQENRSFDSYFGMLNPYRKANGWNMGDDGKDYEVDGIDDKLTSVANDTDEGQSYSLFKLKSTCVDDMTSSWLESYGDVSRWSFLTTRPIAMDGFVHTAEGYAKSCASSGTCSGNFTDLTGQRAMGYYDQDFLNYYYFMASQFAVSDRWFSPVSTKSVGNRIATYTGGTTQGIVFDPGSNDRLPQLSIPTIFQALDAANVSWRIYYTVTQGLCLGDDECTGGSANFPATTFSTFTYSTRYLYENPSGLQCTGTTQPSSVVGDDSNSFCIDTNHIAPIGTFYTDVANGTLPSFAYIEPGSGHNDEHPGSGQSILLGQAEVASLVNALMGSSSWRDSVFFLSYDEGGGPYDHVPPVPGFSNRNTDASLGTLPDIAQIAVNADGYNPCVPSGGIPTLHCDLFSNDPGANSGDAAAQQGFAAQLGFRLPNIVISPFTRRHYVSHTPMDHTAVIQFVESRFIGPTAHLTARDRAQSNLLEFFDFSAIPWATPPTPPAPVTAAALGYDPCMPTNMGP